MVKVLLVKPKEPQGGSQKNCVMPPLGLYTLRALIGKKHEVEILDLHLGELIDPLMFWKPDIVGISCQFSIQHDEMLEIAKFAQLYGARVIAGGFHASTLKEIPNVNQVIHGPGEEKVASILGLPRPSVHVYPQWSEDILKPYWEVDKPHNLTSKTKKWVNMETSRGCNYGCGFCGVGNFWGKWKGIHMAKIGQHLLNLMTIGVEEVFIEDDNLTHDEGHFWLIMDALQGVGMYWSTPNGIRVRSLTPEVIERMAQSHCWRVSLPFETGYRRTAELMKLGSKWLPLEEARVVVENLRDAGIETAGFFIIGYPGETPSDIKRTLDYANSLPLDDRYVYIATPYPGTPLYALCKREGYLTYDGEDLYRELRYSKALINTPWLSPDDIERLREEDRSGRDKD